MTKGLNSLNVMVTHLMPQYGMSRNSLIDFRNIEKELKALEIIKAMLKELNIKNDITELPHLGLVAYEIRIGDKSFYLKNKEDYDLLKEVLL